jgi:RimJ/RimL family protein N-acetyltransferase
MNVAIDGGRIGKGILREAFAIPFERLKCTRVSGLVRADNLAAQRFDEHLGFKREGVIRQGDDDGCDLIVYGMLKSECRWLGI